MSSKKKDLEIIFNLQWKYGPKVAERSNIVGVYDLPSTTLNWEPFKSYILKNSGTPGDDVKVSYIEDGREFAIESTLDFQTALYTFRKKAMNGEIINLRLDRLSNGIKSVRLSPTCDAQTECSYDCKLEMAPEWFVSYMAEFKKDILNEVASAITTHVAVFKPSISYSHYPRKSKAECTKRCRKNHHLDGNEKEVLKTMKLEKKLESKMEKLVNKSKKLKEKKMSLITKSSDSDAGHSSSKSNSETISTIDISKMGAAPVRFDESSIPHLMGGEVYRHCWKVINNGLLPWTEDTELHFSWGSSLLEPIQRVIACPLLNPGEVGSIEALIHVPKICGRYQMYWHFHHKGRKFGHWLGCEIIVDKINSTEQLSTSFLRSISSRNDKSAFATKIDPEFETPYGSLVDNRINLASKEYVEKDMNAEIPVVEEKMKDLYISENTSSSIKKHSYEDFNKEIEELIINKSPSKIQIVEKYSGDADDNKSGWNLDITNNSTQSMQTENEDNVNEEDDEDSHSESISKIDEETSSNSTLNDMVMVNFPDEIEEQPIKGYAYIKLHGVKTAIPKKYLRADYLETAEEAPDPEITQIMTGTYVEHIRELVKNSKIDDHRVPSHDNDNEEYDDLPDLIASSDEDEPPVRFVVPNVVAENVSVPPQRLFVFSERFAGYEFIGDNAGGGNEELVSDAKEGKDCRNAAVKDEIQQPENIPIQQVLGRSPFHGEKISTPNSTPYEDSGTSNIYPLIDLNHFLPHIPNYQQTPPEFRPKLNPYTQEIPKASSKISYSVKPEIININNAYGITNSNAHGERSSPSEVSASSSIAESDRQRAIPEAAVPISSVVSEAMTMASSALKTVVNKIIPSKNEQELGVWVNGHWVPTTENSIRENNLKILADMGFNNRDHNATLLARYDDDIRRVVTELVQ